MTALDTLINAAALAVFAEPVIYRSGNIDIELHAIFNQQRHDASSGLPGYTDTTYSLDALKTDLDAAGVELRQAIIVGDRVYRIIDWQTDRSGMSTLTLRPYVAEDRCG